MSSTSTQTAEEALTEYYVNKYGANTITAENYDERFSDVFYNKANRLEFLKEYYPANATIELVRPDETEAEIFARSSRYSDFYFELRGLVRGVLEAQVAPGQEDALDDLLEDPDRIEGESALAICLANSGVTYDEVESKLPDILAQLNVPQCIDGTGGFLSPFAIGGANVNIGCEQVLAFAQAYVQSINATSCMITNISSTGDIAVSNDQSISIIVGEDALFDCSEGELRFENNSNIKLVALTNFVSKVDREVNSVIKTSLQQAFNFLQESKKGFMSTPQGQKSAIDLLDQINSGLTDAQQTNISTSYTTGVSNVQNIVIELAKRATLTGSKCVTLNQNVVDVMVENLVSAQFETLFSLESSVELFQNISAGQKAVSEGIGGLLWPLVIFAVLATIIIVFFFKSKAVKELATGIKVAIIIFSILALIGGCVGLYFGVFKKDDPEEGPCVEFVTDEPPPISEQVDGLEVNWCEGPCRIQTGSRAERDADDTSTDTLRPFCTQEPYVCSTDTSAPLEERCCEEWSVNDVQPTNPEACVLPCVPRPVGDTSTDTVYCKTISEPQP